MRTTQGDHRDDCLREKTKAIHCRCIHFVLYVYIQDDYFREKTKAIHCRCIPFVLYVYIQDDYFREKTKAIHCGCIPFQLSQIVLAGGQTQTGLHISYYTYIFNIHYTRIYNIYIRIHICIRMYWIYPIHS